MSIMYSSINMYIFYQYIPVYEARAPRMWQPTEGDRGTVDVDRARARGRTGIKGDIVFHMSLYLWTVLAVVKPVLFIQINV